MIDVGFIRLDSIDASKITFVVIVAKYQDKLVLVRHRDRLSWEIPGGHVEKDEPLELAARRELFEETGAEIFSLTPVSIYSVNNNGALSFGQVYYAEITKLGALPDLEITEIKLFSELPENLTYPLIQPEILKKVREWTDGTYSMDQTGN